MLIKTLVLIATCFFSIGAFGKPTVLVEGFLSKIDGKYIVVQTEDKEFTLSKTSLTKKQLQSVRQAKGKELQLRIALNGIVKHKKKKPSKSVQRMIANHKKMKKRKTWKSGR